MQGISDSVPCQRIASDFVGWFESRADTQAKTLDSGAQTSAHYKDRLEELGMMIASDVLLGRTADGARVFVTVETSEHTGNSQTTEHDPISAWTRISITGHVTEKYCREWSQGGQIESVLERIKDFAPGWNNPKVQHLAAIWRRWHLNDVQAGCAHMDLPADASYDARKDIRCPVTGYKYGSAWLVLPEADTQEAIARLRELFDA